MAFGGLGQDAPKGNGNGDKRRPSPGPSWIGFGLTILSGAVTLAVLWGSLNTRVDYNSRAVNDIGTIKEATTRLEENMKALKEKVDKQGKQIDRLVDFLSDYIIKENGKTRGFRGVE